MIAAARSPRLLVLAPSYPFPPQNGTQLRLLNLLRRLPRSVRVTLLCFHSVPETEEQPLPKPLEGRLVAVPQPSPAAGPAASPWAQLFRTESTLIWRFHSAEMLRQVRRRGREADGALAVGLQLGPYLRALPGGVPTILDDYNIESLVLERLALTRSGPRRWYWRAEAAKLRRAERRLVEEADLVFAISETDRSGLQKLAPRGRIATVPMGIDLDFYRPSPLPTNGDHIFSFLGSFNWHVNQDAAEWLCRQVWPRVRSSLPKARLELVGRDPGPDVRALAEADSVRVTGTVPDVRPFLGASRATLVPLRYGSGVRTKILEAFAAGRPVVSTSVGCEGLPVESGTHLLVADTEEAFARACVSLAEDRGLAERLVRSGGAMVKAQDALATHALREALEGVLPGMKERV